MTSERSFAPVPSRRFAEIVFARAIIVLRVVVGRGPDEAKIRVDVGG